LWRAQPHVQSPTFQCTSAYDMDMTEYKRMWDVLYNKTYQLGWDELYIEKLVAMEQHFNILGAEYA
jgi:hypothetical protein